jgi:hypothetical protein
MSWCALVRVLLMLVAKCMFLVASARPALVALSLL